MKIYKNLSDENKVIVNVIAILVLLLICGSLVSKYWVEDGGMSISQSEKSFIGGSADVDMYMEEDMGRVSTMPIMPPSYGQVPGVDAESFEVSEYYVSIETRDRDRDCDIILSLKSREDVIFDNVNESEYGCNVSFKVKREAVDSVLASINELNPRDISESTYTIKREVGEYENQIEILTKKLTSLEQALTSALANYAEVEAIARRQGDVATLAKVIESKVTIIERITASRLEVVAELDRLSVAKAESLDRMNFVHFSVNVSENDWVQGHDLKDSWVASLQELISDFNTLLQDISIGFVQFLFVVIKYTLYASVLFLVGRPIVRKARVLWSKM
jgi:hypothetical protein